MASHPMQRFKIPPRTDRSHEYDVLSAFVQATVVSVAVSQSGTFLTDKGIPAFAASALWPWILFLLYLLIPLPVMEGALREEDVNVDVGAPAGVVAAMAAQKNLILPTAPETYCLVGAGGFVGSRAAILLADLPTTGSVRCFDIAYSDDVREELKKHPKITKVITGNVLNESDLDKSFDGVDSVITTFATIRFWERLDKQKKSSWAVNVDGIRNVIAACKRQKVKRLVNTSTSNVFLVAEKMKLRYGMKEDDSPYVEMHNKPHWYSYSKAEGEKLVLAANSEHLATAAIRPCSSVFGFRDKIHFDMWFEKAAFLVLDPLYVEDWVHHENVIYALFLADARLREGHTANAAGLAYNISNEALTFYDMAVIARAFYRKVFGAKSSIPGITRVPIRVLVVLAHLTETIARICPSPIDSWYPKDLLILQPSTIFNSTARYSISWERAYSLLGYEPVFTLEQAVRDTMVREKARREQVETIEIKKFVGRFQPELNQAEGKKK
jgi:nucleoside-diphosphate-sugar epimerase